MAILGIGTDIIEIGRIEKTLSKNGGTFLKRYFTDAENELFLARKLSAQTVAANFAAKEAYVKALGTGFTGISLCEIETLRDTQGKPYINTYGAALKKAETAGVTAVHVSLSHTEQYAQAFVILEKI